MINFKILKAYLNNKYFLFIGLIVSVLLCLWLYSFLYDIHKGADMRAKNDEWEHQSLAVNYAKGFGLFKLGGYSNFEDYHIEKCDRTFPFLIKLFTKYPTEYYHRACGFSVITGTLYKITGTHPINLRIFNFALIIFSWLLIYYAHYLYSDNKKLSRIILAALPLFIIINFPFIDLIGDDTLTLFSLSLVFISLLQWWKKPDFLSTLYLLLSLLFSIFIKSTLIFIPFFLFITALFLKKKNHLISSVILNFILISSILIYSKELNKRHHQYKYAAKEQFHSDMLQSEWNKEDSLFIQKHALKFIDDVSFDFDMYKKIAAYLFERQFYTQRMFLLSGQSWFLLIDGNNECCAAKREEYTGSWAPYWRFYKESFYYNYDENTSANTALIKFYLHKPYWFPILVYFKWQAAYYWSYLFILFSSMQTLYYYILKKKLKDNSSIVKAGIFILLFHIMLQQLSLTPFIVLLFIVILYKLIKEQNNAALLKSNFYYMISFITLYFTFLSTIMFGLNRYTSIANGMFLVGIIQLIYFSFEERDKKQLQIID